MSRPRSLAPDDRRRLLTTANEWCRRGLNNEVSFTALRTRAFVALSLSSGLRVGELCKLDVLQMLDRTERGWTLRSHGYLRGKQSKGRRAGTRTWNSAGSFFVNKNARQMLRAYVREARRRGWMQWPPAEGAPLFLTVKDRGGRGAGADHHVRMSRRTAQHSWQALQARAGVKDTYGVHCLRHEFMTRIADASGGNVFQVAAAGRCDIRTALRYVHGSPAELQRLVERSSSTRAARLAR